MLQKDSMIKLNTGFSGFSPDELANLGDAVATNLPTIAIFNTLTPTPAQIATAVTNLRNAIKSTGPSRDQQIDGAFQALSDLLGHVAENAMQVANVTDANLAAIGLPVAKSRVRSTAPPEICPNLRLRHGDNPGEVFGTCDPPGPNIRIYELQWTFDPNAGPWNDGGSFPNSRAFKLTGMQRGKDIWVRVRAVNTNGPGGWSDPATIMVT